MELGTLSIYMEVALNPGNQLQAVIFLRMVERWFESYKHYNMIGMHNTPRKIKVNLPINLRQMLNTNEKNIDKNLAEISDINFRLGTDLALVNILITIMRRMLDN